MYIACITLTDGTHVVGAVPEDISQDVAAATDFIETKWGRPLISNVRSVACVPDDNYPYRF